MLDIFIEGESVDLAVPNLEFAGGDIWYAWFNDPSITRFLEQGAYPNTPEQQKQFFNSIQDERLALIIQNKKEKPVGVVSLSSLNYKKNSCDFAIVIDTTADIRLAGIGALEASALIIEHGFDMLGLDRITAGQHVDLISWQQRLELIGFKLEGYHESKFVKGSEVADSVTIAVNRDDFQTIKSVRGGRLWDSSETMKKRIKNLPKISMRERMDTLFKKERKDYYNEIFNL